MSWKPCIRRSGQPLTRFTDLHAILVDPDPRFVTVWVDMQEFCRVVNMAFLTDYKIDPELYQQVMTSVLYRLLHMIYENKAQGEDYNNNTRDSHDNHNEAVCLCTLALAATVFIQTQDKLTQYEKIAARLKAFIPALEQPTDEAAWGLRLWLLVATGISQFRIGTSGDWLREPFREALQATNTSSWQQAKGILKAHLWIDTIHDRAGEDFYDRLAGSIPNIEI
jgi:hypothetical protein